MSLDERYTVDTPENIAFSYAVAGIGSRFLAAIIDTAILFLIQIALIVVAITLSSVAERQTGNTDTITSIIMAVWAILSFAFFWGFYIFFEMFWNGQTPGKRLISLRVVREGGRPVTFVASAIRNLIRFIDFLPGFYGLGVLVMFIDRRARRLGDLAGGTLVVKDRGALSLDSLVAQTEQQKRAEVVLTKPDGEGKAAFTPTIPNLHLLTTSDYDLVQEFLRRRKELGSESRTSLAKQLTETIINRLGIALDHHTHAETFLEHLVSEYRQLRAGE